MLSIERKPPKKQNNRGVKFKLNYALNIKITKIIEDCHGSVDLLDVPVGRTYKRRKKNLAQTVSYWD